MWVSGSQSPPLPGPCTGELWRGPASKPTRGRVCRRGGDRHLWYVLPCSPAVLNSNLESHRHRMVNDETILGPATSYDGIIGNMNMHWINDLESTRFCGETCDSLIPGRGWPSCACLSAPRRSLHGHAPGRRQSVRARVHCIGKTEPLMSSRSSSLTRAQLEIEGGVSPRVSPVMCTQTRVLSPKPLDASDLARLLGTCQFRDITIDVEKIEVLFPTLRDLLDDLKLLGESSALVGRYAPSAVAPHCLGNRIYEGTSCGGQRNSSARSLLPTRVICRSPFHCCRTLDGRHSSQALDTNHFISSLYFDKVARDKPSCRV